MLNSVLSVTVAATSAALTDLTTVRDELGLTDTTSDTKLTRYINAASKKISQYCNRVFVTETVQETWRAPANPSGGLAYNLSDEPLHLSRWPVQSITSVVVDGAAPLVANTDYIFEPDTGNLYRLDANGRYAAWSFNYTLVVTYVAGYVDQEDDVAFAALNLVRLLWYSQPRDPTIKSESTVGVDSVTYDTSAGSPKGLSPEDQILATLDNYRVPVVGAI